MQQQDGVRHYWTLLPNWHFDFKSKLASVADQDGDGVRDIMVSSPWQSLIYYPRVTFVSGRSGEEIRTEEHREYLHRYGRGIGDAGDVNGDGIDDYVIGNPDGSDGMGKVEVKSGADGSLIWEFEGLVSGQQVGCRVGGVGDVNGDGFADIASSGGGTFIASGATGEILQRLPAGNFCRANDLNGDGHDDIVISFPGATPNGLPSGEAVAYSGIDGAALWRMTGPWLNADFGHAIDIVGDLNGDGSNEVLIGAPAYDNQRGAACLLDGGTGLLLQQFFGNRVDDKFGVSVAGTGDMNGDGVIDFAIGAKQKRVLYGGWGGYVAIISGVDYEIICPLRGGRRSNFGHLICAPGDINDDGQADLIVGSPGVGGQNVAAFGFNPFLLASSHELSASATQPVQFEITFPAAEGLRTYRLLASHSGVGPTSINGFEIPLTWDALLQAGMSGTVPPVSSGFVGVLDVNGRAVAQLAGRPYLARWPGARVYIAAVSFETIGSIWICKNTSIPVTLEINP
ncbi:MAG: hypothetical protein H8E15_04745 [Planctomycetes bacterium]|nr:hypothetical protein [Planctomycetota bacterium]